MGSQLALVQAGDTAAAEQVAERRTVPALDAFESRVAAANAYYESAADRASRVSDLGLWIALMTAGLAIAGLSWRHERARRASQAVLEERLQERVAEVAEITERHRQLEALKYSFVSAVSHELRTPLTAIHGSLEMLEDGDVGPLSTDAAQVVSVAARGTRRLSRLVEDIIDLERLESGSFGFYPAAHTSRPAPGDRRVVGTLGRARRRHPRAPRDARRGVVRRRPRPAGVDQPGRQRDQVHLAWQSIHLEAVDVTTRSR